LFLVLKLYYLEISSCNNQINKQYACQIKDTVNLLENIAEIVDSKELYDIHFYKNLETKSNTKMLETIYSYNHTLPPQ